MNALNDECSYLASGDYQKAGACFRKAADFEPENKKYKEKARKFSVFSKFRAGKAEGKRGIFAFLSNFFTNIWR